MKGILNAANNFLDSFDKKPLFQIDDQTFQSSRGEHRDYLPTSLPSICRRLGELFAIFQSYPYIIVTPESASLSVGRRDLRSEIIDAIEFGIMNGALLKIEDNSTMTVGLHPALSPLFNISFRNPFYYPQRVSTDDFSMLLMGNEAQVKKQKIIYY